MEEADVNEQSKGEETAFGEQNLGKKAGLKMLGLHVKFKLQQQEFGQLV